MVFVLRFKSFALLQNTFGITDKRVSREQIEVLVDIDKKSVTIIQKGLNPCTLTQPNGKKKTTTKDQPFELFDNDSFGLIGDEFVCKLEVIFVVFLSQVICSWFLA